MGCKSNVSGRTKLIGMVIESAREELEAIRKYSERIDEAEAMIGDGSVKETAINDAVTSFFHARREEGQHFAFFVEWLRRNDAGFGESILSWIGTDKPFSED